MTTLSSAFFAKNDFDVDSVDTTFCADKVMGSIINLSMRTAMEKLVGKIPSEYDFELLHSAKPDWAYKQALHRSGKENGTAAGAASYLEGMLKLLELQKPTTPRRGG